MSYLLDTDICIHYLKGEDDALRNRILACSPDEIFLCSVVKAELLYGARKSRRISENLAKLERFFAPMQSLFFTDEAASHYGSIRAQLEASGKPIGANDMLIAAISLASDLTLVTRNLREFRRVPSLRVENW